MILIDGDYFLYRYGYPVEKTIKLGDKEVKLAEAGVSVHLIRNKIKHYMKLLKANDYLIVLSGSNNWRYSVYPSYKSNRKSTKPPVGIKESKALLEKDFKCLKVDGLEADDVISLLVNGAESVCGVELPKASGIVVSPDKDFFGIPGIRLFHCTGNRLFPEVSKAQATCFWLAQAIMGDAVDGYSGFPGWGPRSVQTLLKRLGSGTVGEALESAREKLSREIDDEYVHQQAAVARMLRPEDLADNGLKPLKDLHGWFVEVFDEEWEYWLPYYDEAHTKLGVKKRGA